MPGTDRYDKLLAAGFATFMIGGLYLASLQSYLLFHTLIEIFTVAVGFTLFLLFWNTRKYVECGYLRLLGVGYAFIALIDLLHALAYKGMGVFPGDGANLATQLWIAARYLQALALLLAPLFVAREPDNRAILVAYVAAVAVLLALVFGGYFPDCYIEGKGLTSFKISSEYVICAALTAALYLFYREKNSFSKRVFYLVLPSIILTIFSELAFTTYVSVYGFANLIGHFLKLGAYYFMCRAIAVTSLDEPMSYIFGGLKLTEEELRKTRETIIEEVGEGTVALRNSERQYRSLIQTIHVLAEVTRGSGVQPQRDASTIVDTTEAKCAGGVAHRR